MEKILQKATKLSEDQFFAKFPHLEKRIRIQWGSQECRDFLLSLTGFFEPTKDRKSRQGFSSDELSVIIQLMEKHDAAFPQFDVEDEVPFSSYSGFTESTQTTTKRKKKVGQTNWSGVIWIFLLTAIVVAFFHYK